MNLAAWLLLFTANPAKAEETNGEKAATKIDEVSKDSKKAVRKIKKKARDATGNESLSKDVGDQLNNTSDEVKYQGKKTKRKID